MTNIEMYIHLERCKREVRRRKVFDLKLLKPIEDALNHLWYMLLDRNEQSELLVRMKEEGL